ncbi:MAG TPA: response regulator [Chloroflexota bacterium]|jgi:CheY-like chemotaxis protein|nr:response regulator [Chloroflexota bacterium]
MEHGTSSARRSATEQATAGPAVLVVDDDAALRAVVAIHLRVRLGVEVVQAGDALSALRCARAVPVALVLTDVQMPGLDGCALVHLLKNDPATAALPVVAMSGNLASLTAARAAGCDGVLPKPFPAGEPAATVRRWLAGGGPCPA